MISNISYGEQAQAGILSGIDAVADAVRVTLGPRGRNVLMYQKANVRDSQYSDRAQAGAPVLSTNDGATIAKSIVLADGQANMGAQLVVEAASKTDEEVGDGTSTAIVLAQALLHEAFKNVAAGADPLALKRGLKAAGGAVLAQLEGQAHPVQTEEELAFVAQTSCQDPELARLVAHAMHTVGLEGVLTVDEGQRPETTLRVDEGIVFDRGYLSPVMCTDDKKTVAELRDCYILLCDKKFTDPQELLDILIAVAEAGCSCLIVCDGIEGAAMGFIAQNALQGDMDIVAVEQPLYGDGRRWRMEDLAVQTGGTFISEEMGYSVRDATLDMLGFAEYVKVTKKQTIITGAAGDPELVQTRVQELRKLVEITDYEFNKQRYKERLACFVSGVAKIEVGGVSELEMWERKMRVEDAVRATRAAFEGGALAGGGTALVHAAGAATACAQGLVGDERTGAEIVARACLAPAAQIAQNAGENGRLMVQRMAGEPEDVGYNAATGALEDLFAAGVVDSLAVTTAAFECALSTSASVLTSAASVVDAKAARRR